MITYPTLSSISKLELKNDHRLKICIVTPDINGPVHGGGIGTAYYNLASLLQKSGHDVSILYTLGKKILKGSINKWQRHFKHKGITFIPLPDMSVPISRGKMGLYLKTQIHVYEWLKNEQFDIVHAPEWKAHIFLCLTAKRLGISFGKTLFCIGAHSPTLWNMIGNNRLLTNDEQLVLSFMERKCVELADFVISPSQYMLNWMSENGFKLPSKRSYVQPNIVNINNINTINSSEETIGKDEIEHIVFFGRFDARKGFYVFCKAIDLIDHKLIRGNKIIFLGRDAHNIRAKDYIKRCSQNWESQYKIIEELDSNEAISFLKKNRCLAVMPSLIDNSPYTVLECIVNRIPFIVGNVGGISELIQPAHTSRVTTVSHPKKLASKMTEVLSNGTFCPDASFDNLENERSWITWHSLIQDKFNYSPYVYKTSQPAYHKHDIPQDPKVSVCIPHFNRGNLLLQAIHSLKNQDYENIEVIVVDDGSDHQESIDIINELESDFKNRGWKIIRQENQYPGVARNKAVEYSNGDYLLFMDDDNYAMPDEISKLVSIAIFSNADVLTCFRRRFVGMHPPNNDNLSYLIPALGNAIAVGMLFNCFGDANCLVKRRVFSEIGGFSTDYGCGKEDEEFLGNIASSGYNLMVVPEVLYYYRGSISKIRSSHIENLGSEKQFTGDLRALRPYSKLVPPELHDLLYLTRGLNLARDIGMKQALIQTLRKSSGINTLYRILPKSIKKYFLSLSILTKSTMK